MNNKILIIAAAIIVVILIAIAIISWYNYFRIISSEPKSESIVSAPPQPAIDQKAEDLKKQLQELDELRAQANAKQLTQEEINKQLKELDAYRKKVNIK